MLASLEMIVTFTAKVSGKMLPRVLCDLRGLLALYIALRPFAMRQQLVCEQRMQKAFVELTRS